MRPTEPDFNDIIAAIDGELKNARVREVGRYAQENPIERVIRESSGAFNQVEYIRIRDYKNKIASRKWVSCAIILLLFLQNAALFGWIIYLLNPQDVATLREVVSILVISLLGETYFLVKKVVEWQYKDIEYDLWSQN